MLSLQDHPPYLPLQGRVPFERKSSISCVHGESSTFSKSDSRPSIHLGGWVSANATVHRNIVVRALFWCTYIRPTRRPTYTSWRSSWTFETWRSCPIPYHRSRCFAYIVGLAEVLTKPLVDREDLSWCFTRSPSLPYSKHQKLNRTTRTVLAVHSIFRRACLPIDTYILAALIIRELPLQFYQEWHHILKNRKRPLDDIVKRYRQSSIRFELSPEIAVMFQRTREIVIVTALVQAGYVLH